MQSITKLLKNIILAVTIGLLVGAASLFFDSAIKGGTDLTKDYMIQYRLIGFLMPITGGIITFFLYTLFLKDDHTGVGIVQVLVELDHIKTHLMKPFRVMIRVILATITLIFGFSAGRFGPIVHLGASIGSNIGYFLKLSSNDVRLLIGCGAAAAIAAVFQMPLFAAVFTLEVLYKKQYANYFAPVIIASITGYYLGSFTTNLYTLQSFDYSFDWSINMLIAYVLFGFLMGICGILFIKNLRFFSLSFGKIKRIPYRLLLAALLIAIIGIFFPLNFELHSSTTQRILSGEFSIKMLLLIGFVKYLATGITLGSGYIGGNFYPGVTIGAALGTAFGKIYSKEIPSVHFGLLGLGALIASYFNAPLSGIVLILEFSQDVAFLVPALIVCSISVSTCYHLYGFDIFTHSYEQTCFDLAQRNHKN